MSRAQRIAFMLSFALAPLGAPDAVAQKGAAPKTVSEKSYARARQVLEAGLAALGGLDAIREARDVSLKVRGHQFARNQSVRVDGPFDRTGYDESVYIDLNNRRYLFETRAEAPGGFVFGGRNVVNGGQGFFVNPRDKTITPMNMANFNNVFIIRRLPHVMLLALHDTGAQGMRYLGEDALDGRRHNVIAAATPNGVQWALYFDAATNLLTKQEIVVSDNLAGDTTHEWVFPGYRTVGRLKVPTGRVTRRAGELIEEVTYDDVQFNTRPAETAFAKPEGHEELPAPTPPPTRETKLAEGVHLFESGANALVVEFADHLLVVEPYAGGRGSRATLAKLKEMFPSKPVRYVVVTHFHDDHSGGLRPYVAVGARIVTTAANQKFFERMASSAFTVAPDEQSVAKRKPVFEFVEGGRRVFTDGRQTVEVIDVGPNPHAREMLVAYLPKEKLVFQGDLVNLPSSGRFMPSTIIDATTHFLETITRLNLDVERIASVHGPSTTLKDLREAAARSRPQSSSQD